ncbi:MAG: hypothetical protein MAG451_01173 [Anaerolineales bacterium]|nr:hypothetical protein [Anaerolineales bacterium]
MNPDSRQIIHIGINLVISPLPAMDARSRLQFQQSLIESGIDYGKVEFKEKEMVVVREAPTRLEIKVAATNTPNVGQLLILAPHPKRALISFEQEAEAIVQAFNATWPADNRRIVSTDVTLRELYETTERHAFQEIWEKLLGQPIDRLSAFGRSVSGGGLRFVMPPQQGQGEPVQVEVKIESYLRNARKIYVETQLKWPQPLAPGAPLNPRERLEQANEYLQNNVLAFLAGDTQSP